MQVYIMASQLHSIPITEREVKRVVLSQTPGARDANVSRTSPISQWPRRFLIEPSIRRLNLSEATGGVVIFFYISMKDVLVGCRFPKEF